MKRVKLTVPVVVCACVRTQLLQVLAGDVADNGCATCSVCTIGALCVGPPDASELGGKQPSTVLPKTYYQQPTSALIASTNTISEYQCHKKCRIHSLISPSSCNGCHQPCKGL